MCKTEKISVSRRLGTLEGLEDHSSSILYWLHIDSEDHPHVDVRLEKSYSFIVILGDFNASDTRFSDHAGRFIHYFALAHDLTQLTTLPMQVPDVMNHPYWTFC